MAPSPTSTRPKSSLLVVSRYLPEEIKLENKGVTEKQGGEPILSEADRRNDAMDDFNHPRYRRALILKELSKKHRLVQFMKPSKSVKDLSAYRIIQSEGLIDFFETAWAQWDDLGQEGQDPMTALSTTEDAGRSPPLIPGNVPLPREQFQRPSRNIMGKVGYYCTDTCTPIFGELREELEWDVAVVQQAIDNIHMLPVVYALATHPGHHAAQDSFGGYCYLNHAAFAAKRIQQQYKLGKVAVLDVDYVS